MITSNLGLETIEATDKIQTSLLQKMNNNFQKIKEGYDNAYNVFKEIEERIIIKTGKDNLQEAMDYFEESISYKVPTLNVELTGSYTNYIGNYGAIINKDGELVIWALGNSSAYDHVYFVASSLATGTKKAGWDVYPYGTSDSASILHSCMLENVDITLNSINIRLNADAIDSSYDYVRLSVTITAE